MILCDIGNTTYHFLVNGKHKKYFLDEKVPKFDEELYFVSVNEKGTKRLLKKNPQAKNIKDILKFETIYQVLGIDRAVACSFQQNAVIVDAGSAITVDIIENGVHKGGFILLGLRRFMKSYPKISKKLNLILKKI